MNNLLTGLLTSEESLSIGMMIIFFFVMFLIILGIYIYSSFALMAIAKKTKNEPAWLAWIPIANLFLISKIAKMHWWPILLIIPAFISFGVGFILIALGQNILGIILIVIYALILILFSVFSTIWCWKMFEAIDRPGWWSLVSIIPAIIYLAFYFSGSVILTLIGSTISLAGTIAYMALLGVGAWSDSPKTVTKNIKQVKTVTKNKQR